MGEQENTRHDLLAGPAFELGEEPGEEAEHSSAIKSGSEEPGAGAGEGEESDQEPGEELPRYDGPGEPGDQGEEPPRDLVESESELVREPGTRHPVGVIYGRRVVLAWNISEGMAIFVQGKLISPEWDPNPQWLIVVWNEGRLVMKGTVFSGKQWVVKIAQKLRNAATCRARSLRVKRAAKRRRLGEGEAEGEAEHSSAIKSGSEGEPGEGQEAVAL